MSKLEGRSKSDLIARFLGKNGAASGGGRAAGAAAQPTQTRVSQAFTRFDHHPGYQKILVPKVAADRFGVPNPFFKVHEGIAGATTRVGGRELINFANYNYLGLNGHPSVNQAASDAILRYGTTPSASRLVAGERPVQQELEQALAALYEVEDCVVFVSGHATNVTTIGYLFGPKDLILHDSLIHNSVLEGARLSGATRRSFPHNDAAALDAILAEVRPRFERVLIVIEGLYSMDGDIPDLPAFIDIKRRHAAFLMVDEAHSLGVLGQSGRGLREHFGVAGKDVDIWMGTLSKTLASCGGYIAGERALVEHLKYAAPGFVYSVGISPPLAAASLEALRIMLTEPQRVHQLRARTGQFLQRMQEYGINTGYAQGYAVVPVITGSSIKAGKLSEQMFQAGVNAQPIIYPAVEEKAARLRFFFSAMHSEEQITTTCELLRKLVG